MTNLSVIENKISAARKYLKIVQGYKQYSQKELVSDLNLRGAVERYLYLAVQAAIDLAEAVIAYKQFRKPATMRETFEILKEEKIIGAELTEQLADMVGFRNIIAHDYGEVDYDIVYDILHNRLADIEKFISIVEDSVE